MAFEYVDWQPDDEAVGIKFKQMSDNDQWLSDNMISGKQVNRASGNGTLPAGKPVGSFVAKKAYGLYQVFDSLVTTPYYNITITYPSGVFTTPPVIVATVATPNLTNHWVCTVTLNSSTTHAKVSVFRRDGASDHFAGALNVMLLGY